MKRLRKFIREKHSDNNYIFWPDLASSHYAKSVTRWMHANHINFVPKENNPPNCSPNSGAGVFLPVSKIIRDISYILWTIVIYKATNTKHLPLSFWTTRQLECNRLQSP